MQEGDHIDTSKTTCASVERVAISRDLDDVIDATQAAMLLGVRRQHLVKLLQRGDLFGKRLTATWVTTRQAVEDYDRRRRPRGRPPRTDRQ